MPPVHCVFIGKYIFEYVRLDGEESPLYTENETNMAKHAEQQNVSKQRKIGQSTSSTGAAASKHRKMSLLSGKKDAFHEYVVKGECLRVQKAIIISIIFYCV